MPAQNQKVQITRSVMTKPARQAAESALLYILMCISYILLSGFFASRISVTPHHLYVIETFKGVIFVVGTGVLFFIVSCMRLRKLRRQEESIIVQEMALLRAEKKVVAAMFAATVVHDTNNLLMSLSGLIENLKERAENDPFLFTMHEELTAGFDLPSG